MARMPARMASGSVGHAVAMVTKSGSFCRFSDKLVDTFFASELLLVVPSSLTSDGQRIANPLFVGSNPTPAFEVFPEKIAASPVIPAGPVSFAVAQLIAPSAAELRPPVGSILLFRPV